MKLMIMVHEVLKDKKRFVNTEDESLGSIIDNKDCWSSWTINKNQ